MNKKELNLKEKLSMLINSIEAQYITLKNIEFTKLIDIPEFYPDKVSVEHKLEVGVGTGLAKEENKELKVITITYRHNEKLLIDDNKEPVLIMTIEYGLDVLLKENSESLEEILKDEEVLEKYAKGTGLLTVYPYIRHMADILHREARVYIPPYTPLKVKQPE